ncbi:two component transcriptional regulator, LuxR family [Gloeothece citriformis PCC 7424]|uniref:Two component transcriptional regulator, LuxR family n=1 Tax=Gloeothece citriformis (strain PCC 7424) TaxID=65393 RepID=B7K9F1_GLOC7|nr:response regulator transcription factor [Gloeothece citriformis]ACK68634.1 two component transcriptional regulator, LuxR family [Gloeothece citriformis PCC 7424]
MNKIRVALIEDHDLTRVGLRTALKNYSEIDWLGEAGNGRDGLQLLQNTLPDVAIVDIGLPDLDGIELTKLFKDFQEQNPNSLTKILILTLHDTEAEVLAAFAAGADSYCMKNISIDLLLEAIKATYEGNSWLDPAIARIVISQVQTPNLKTEKGNNPASVEAENNQSVENYSLTDRELEVLQLIVDGYSNAAIADQLFITVGTVKTHVRNILNKLCADDRTQAAVRALRAGLVG